jgi:hypothetical protein
VNLSPFGEENHDNALQFSSRPTVFNIFSKSDEMGVLLPAIVSFSKNSKQGTYKTLDMNFAYTPFGLDHCNTCHFSCGMQNESKVVVSTLVHDASSKAKSYR